MKALVCALLLVFIGSGLTALEPGASSPDQVQDQSLPEDSSYLLKLAYNYMMSLQADQALPLFQKVIETEPGNHSAWAGLAWAYNVRHQPRKAMRIIKTQMQKYPAYAPYLIQSGYSLMQLQRYPEARDAYQLAAQLAFADPGTKSVAFQGLAWAYTLLDDQASALVNRRKYENLNPAAYSDTSKLSLYTRVHLGSTASSNSLWGLQQSLGCNTWKLTGVYEDFLISAKSFRKLYGLSLRKQFEPVDVAVSAHQMRSSDTYTYPARQVAFQLSSKLHPTKLYIKPQAAVFYTEYPSFNVQQASARLEAQAMDFKLGYSLAHIYKDSDIPTADEDYLVHKVSLHKALPAKLTAGFHYSLGKDNWYSGFESVIIDSYTRAEKYWAASLTFSPLAWLSLYGQYQKGKDGQSDLIYTSMSVYY